MPTKIKRKVYKDDAWSDDILTEIKSGEIIDIAKILPLVTPGNDLRRGLDEILYGNLGALIVLGVNDELKGIMKGGIELDVAFTPARLFELAKMDGAIVVSDDLKKIISANVHLMPNNQITSTETGIRHRSAQQTAKQSLLPVIAISHRRNIISLFFRDQKYVLQDLSLLIVKANNSLNNLKDYRLRIDSDLNYLLQNEINSVSTVENDALELIQKILYFFKHSAELDNLVIELGDQGNDIMQGLYEYTVGLEESLALLIMDYSSIPLSRSDALILVENLKKLGIRMISDTEKLVELTKFTRRSLATADVCLPKGYRILTKIPKITTKLSDEIIKRYGCINHILNMDPEVLAKELNINVANARYIINQLNRLTENVTSDFLNI